MTGELGRRTRPVARGGVLPLSAEQGLALFDAAPWPVSRCWCRSSWTRPRCGRRPRRTAAAAAARPGPAPGRRAPAVAGDGRVAGPAAGRAAAEADREAVLVELVRAQVAAVLGHARPQAVEPDRAFQDSASTR